MKKSFTFMILCTALVMSTATIAPSDSLAFQQAMKEKATGGGGAGSTGTPNVGIDPTGHQCHYVVASLQMKQDVIAGLLTPGTISASTCNQKPYHITAPFPPAPLSKVCIYPATITAYSKKIGTEISMDECGAHFIQPINLQKCKSSDCYIQ